MSRLKLERWYDRAGNQKTLFGVLAELTHDGAAAFVATLNVSSGTDDGVGLWGLSYIEPFENPNYSVSGSAQFDVSAVNADVPDWGLQRPAQATTSDGISFATMNVGNGFDCDFIDVACAGRML